MHRGRLAPGRYLCVLREKEDWILAKIKAGGGVGTSLACGVSWEGLKGPLDKYAISFCAPPPPPKKKQNKTKKKTENSTGYESGTGAIFRQCLSLYKQDGLKSTNHIAVFASCHFNLWK